MPSLRQPDFAQKSGRPQFILLPPMSTTELNCKTCTNNQSLPYSKTNAKWEGKSLELLTIIVFALALNMDALGTGVAYGVRKIKIPITSLLIISMMSVLSISLSMALGHVLAGCLSEAFAHRLGGLILLTIGVWVLVQSWQDHKLPVIEKEEVIETTEQKIMQIRIKAFGLVIQILREPSKADLDKSGTISPREALLLGVALAMDAFGAGFAVSMMGFDPILTAIVVGIGHIVLTYAGLMLGSGFAATGLGKKMAVLPGFILIALGLLKLH
ncbi:sporulation membrane protein YtaF [Peptococcaceae bacterium 1198_IL3148]